MENQAKTITTMLKSTTPHVNYSRIMEPRDRSIQHILLQPTTYGSLYCKRKPIDIMQLEENTSTKTTPMTEHTSATQKAENHPSWNHLRLPSSAILLAFAPARFFFEDARSRVSTIVLVLLPQSFFLQQASNRLSRIFRV